MIYPDQNKPNQKKILTIGELLWDILPDITVLGGAPANFSYRINSFGFQSYLVTRLGKDELGQKAFKILQEQNLNTSLIQWDESHPTGTVIVQFDGNKKPDYEIVKNVAYDFIEYDDLLRSVIDDIDCFYYGTLVQRSQRTRSTIESILNVNNDFLKFCDINLRKDCFSRETIDSSLHHADILKLNEQEVLALSDILELSFTSLDDILKELVTRYDLVCCLATLEERGALINSIKDGLKYIPGYHVQLEDSLGSGDAFSAAFLYEYFASGDLIKACELGNITGAIVATQKGATQEITARHFDNFRKAAHKQCTDKLFIKYIR